MIENWIDVIARIFEIPDGKGGLVKSYHSFDKTDLPEALDYYPCALGYVTNCKAVISDNLSLLFWTGVTEFHLTPNTQKSNIPYILPFFGRILRATAGAMQLGGLAGIKHFILLPEDNSMQFTRLKYGDEVEHYGIMARWEVKEDVSGFLTVSK
jgi:hypothetical protein